MGVFYGWWGFCRASKIFEALLKQQLRDTHQRRRWTKGENIWTKRSPNTLKYRIPTFPLAPHNKFYPPVPLIYTKLSHTPVIVFSTPTGDRSNKAHTDTRYRNPLKEAEKTELLASKTHTDTSSKPLEEPSSST
jgi:hypothetical protein